MIKWNEMGSIVADTGRKLTFLIPLGCTLVVAGFAWCMDSGISLQLGGLVPPTLKHTLLSMDANGWSPETKGEFAAARIGWGYCSAFFLAICSAAIVLSGITVRNVIASGITGSVPRSPRCGIIGFIVFFVILTVALGATYSVIRSGTGITFKLLRAGHIPGDSIHESLLVNRVFSLLAPAMKSPLERYEFGIYFAGTVACLCIVGAACVVLLPTSLAKGKLSEEPGQEIIRIARQMQCLRTVLYLGMLVLVFSIVQLSSLFGWIVTSVAASSERDQYERVSSDAIQERKKARESAAKLTDFLCENPLELLSSNGETAWLAATGVEIALKKWGEFLPPEPSSSPVAVAASSRVFEVARAEGKAVARGIERVTTALLNALAATWTLLLAAMYFPASMILNKEAHDLAVRVVGEMKRDDSTTSDPKSKLLTWKIENNLDSDLLALIPRFAAVLAPLFTGLASQLFASGHGLFL